MARYQPLSVLKQRVTFTIAEVTGECSVTFFADISEVSGDNRFCKRSVVESEKTRLVGPPLREVRLEFKEEPRPYDDGKAPRRGV